MSCLRPISPLPLLLLTCQEFHLVRGQKIGSLPSDKLKASPGRQGAKGIPNFGKIRHSQSQFLKLNIIFWSTSALVHTSITFSLLQFFTGSKLIVSTWFKDDCLCSVETSPVGEAPGVVLKWTFLKNMERDFSFVGKPFLCLLFSFVWMRILYRSIDKPLRG